MYGEGSEGGRFIPVNVGDEVEVEIEAVGAKGDGIAKKDGFVLFVPGTKEGDKVKVKITKVFRRVGFAEVVGAAAEGGAEEAGQPEEAPAVEESTPAEKTEQPEEAEATSEDSETFGEELENK